MDPIDELLQQALLRDERDWTTAFDDLCRERPEQATELRRRRDVLQSLGMLEPATKRDAEFPERLGEFRLLRRIGGGGMGVVFLAEQERLARNVALKIVRPEQLFFAGSRARFRREAEAVAQLNHPGIVPVYTVGEDQGVPYLVMEWVDGVGADRVLAELKGKDPDDLAGTDLLRAVCHVLAVAEPSPPPPAWNGSLAQVCTRFVSQLARALEHAHDSGVLHRDVKPSNFMLTPAGRAVLIDFGLAAQTGATQLTNPGSQLGSLPYMAPEQFQTERVPVDRRVDVYALGVTLYEMLTLTQPFDAGTAPEVMHAVLTRDPPDPRQHNRLLSADLAAVILKAIAKEPARRYQTAAALADDLDAVLAQRAVAARHATRTERTVRWVRREPLRALALALTGLLLLVGVAGAGYYVASRPLTELGQRQRLDAEIELALATGFAELLTNATERDVMPHFERALQLDGKRADIAASAAFACIRIDRAARAFEILQQCPTHGPIVDRVRSYALQQVERKLEAEQVAATLPALEDPRTHHFEVFLEAEVLRGAAVRRGDDKALRAALLLFLDAAARAPSARLIYLARIATTAGQLMDAEHAVRATAAMTALWPNEPIAWLCSGIALSHVAPARALELLERPSPFESGSMMWSNRGVALAQLQRVPESLAAFERARSLTPASADVHVNLGCALRAARRNVEASAALQAALRLAPAHTGALYNLANVQADLNQSEESMASSRRLLAVTPNHVEGRNNLARTLMGLGRLDEAESELRQVVAARPDLPQGHNNLRRVLTRAQKWTACEQEIRRWIGLKPDDAQAWRNLAMFDLDTRVPADLRSSQEALYAARRAAELSRRGDARILLVLAEALAAKAEAAEAERVLIEGLAVAEAASPRDDKILTDLRETLAELRAAALRR